MTLTPILTIQVSKKAQEQLVDFISSQQLGVGDRLPSLQQLSEALAISTPSIREGLRALEALGVVDIKHGSGIYVSHGIPRVSPILPSISGVRGERVARDFLELRLALEPEVAATAAEFADESDLARLEQDVRDFRRDFGRVANPSSDLGFHVNLCRASHNNAFAAVMTWISQFYAARAKPPKMKDVEDHQRILEAVKRRDPLMARREMTRHLKWIGTFVDKRRRQGRARAVESDGFSQ
jgi:GntR family transcriptional repressor for pyruvate dehydrogenase complex